jgi:PAS domain S-box-containing protein
MTIDAVAQSILNSSRQRICVLDAHGVIVGVNDAWKRFDEENAAQGAVGEVVGSRFREASAAAGESGRDAPSRAWAGIVSVLEETLDRFALDYSRECAAGNRWFRMSVHPMLAPGTGVIVTHEDITDRKLAAACRQHDEARFRSLLQTIPGGVSLKNADGVYTHCNAAFEGFFGVREQEIVGKTDYDFLPPVLAESLHHGGLEAVKTGRWAFETSVPLEQAARQTVLDITQVPMRDATGALLGVLAVAHDITALRSAASKLEQRTHEVERLAAEHAMALSVADDTAGAAHRAREDRLRLETEAKMQSRKMEAVGTLAAGLAHDFNNILCSITGFGEMTIEELPHDSTARQNVQHMLTAGARARDLVARMLLFARERPVQPVSVDLVEQVREALSLLRASLRPSVELSFHSAMDEARTATILADPTQIMQIVMNLCINAADALGNHGIIRIRIEPALAIAGAPAQHRGGICLSVADNGSGMTPDVLERLFDPFFTTKAPGEGSGLGLSVVYGIVTGLGGVIEVRSNAHGGDTGTQFQIFLPIAS